MNPQQCSRLTPVKPCSRDKFILQVLDDTKVFIKSDFLQWVTEQIDKWQRQNSYEPA